MHDLRTRIHHRESSPTPRRSRSAGTPIARPTVWLAVAATLALAQGLAEAIEPDEHDLVATLPPVGEYWVWVMDRMFRHNALFDGDSGEMLGSIAGGTTMTPKPPLYSEALGEFCYIA